MRSRYFRPLFAVGIFCFKVCFIASVIYISVTRAAPIEGPAQPAQDSAAHSSGALDPEPQAGRVQ